MNDSPALDSLLERDLFLVFRIGEKYLRTFPVGGSVAQPSESVSNADTVIPENGVNDVDDESLVVQTSVYEMLGVLE